MIDIDSLTIGEAKRLASLLAGLTGSVPAPTLLTTEEMVPAHPYPVGEAVFIRTVTMHYTGRLVRVTAGELVLTDCAWIADSGRFHVALAKGTLSEVEPYPDGEVVVPRDGVIDVCRWMHDLPRTAK